MSLLKMCARDDGCLRLKLSTSKDKLIIEVVTVSLQRTVVVMRYPCEVMR